MLTKPPVTADQLAALVAPVGALLDARQLDGGLFASTFAVDLAPVPGAPSRVVVKVTGADSSRLLRYERGILGTEAMVYELAADRPDLLMPALLHADFSRQHVDGDAVVAAFLDGELWHSLDLDDATTAVVQRDLGALMSRLHTVTGESFGYPAAASGLSAPTWPEAFGLMMEAVLNDADRFGVAVPAARVRDAVARHRGTLAEVTVPRLVHTDLWPGNLFLDADRHICGVIDTERSVWGDPLLDVVGTDQLGTGPVSPDLVAGYADGGGLLDPDDVACAARLDLYRLYFGVLMSTEMVPRGYEGDWADAQREILRHKFDVVLDRLGV